jgi:uncharacterized protein YsxB (DUF464 family)
MITAKFTKNESGIRLTIDGHAGYSKDGCDDIVCAAVSGIFYALCGYLSNLKKKNYLLNSAEAGYADVECGYDGEEAMKLACIGIWQISLSYPECVRVNNSAWDWRMKEHTA